MYNIYEYASIFDQQDNSDHVVHGLENWSTGVRGCGNIYFVLYTYCKTGLTVVKIFSAVDLGLCLGLELKNRRNVASHGGHLSSV